MLRTCYLRTQREEFVNVTREVQAAITDSGIKSGVCLVFCPHTTADMTINENADPDVIRDLLLALNKTYPDRPEFRHSEGNSAAHLKASVLGSSVLVPVDQGRLVLGVWQGIYFCEFDGPRSRSYIVQVTGE